MNKKSNPSVFSFTNITKYKDHKNVGECSRADKKTIYKSYKIGKKYGNVYFTKREAECMVCLLRGKTLNSVASELKLSPRTVEFYVKNMKAKVGCRTKFELIDMVHASDFMNNVDFV